MIVGYRHIQTGAFLCVPCAYSEDWDLEDVTHIEIIGEEDMRADLPCPYCSVPLMKANTMTRCRECGHLRTVGGLKK